MVREGLSRGDRRREKRREGLAKVTVKDTVNRLVKAGRPVSARDRKLIADNIVFIQDSKLVDRMLRKIAALDGVADVEVTGIGAKAVAA